jgi:hypothetical protein
MIAETLFTNDIYDPFTVINVTNKAANSYNP